MTRSEIETTLRREKEKASVYHICLDLKPLYAAEAVVKPYPKDVTHISRSLTIGQ